MIHLVMITFPGLHDWTTQAHCKNMCATFLKRNVQWVVLKLAVVCTAAVVIATVIGAKGLVRVWKMYHLRPTLNLTKSLNKCKCMIKTHLLTQPL